LAEAVVAETMAAHQQDQERRRVVSGSRRLSEGAGRYCAVSLAKVSRDHGHNAGGAPTGKRNGRYRHGGFTKAALAERLPISKLARGGKSEHSPISVIDAVLMVDRNKVLIRSVNDELMSSHWMARSFNARPSNLGVQPFFDVGSINIGHKIFSAASGPPK
jgi:hypothetical protein